MAAGLAIALRPTSSWGAALLLFFPGGGAVLAAYQRSRVLLSFVEFLDND
jgi:hypothetical protein